MKRSDLHRDSASTILTQTSSKSKKGRRKGKAKEPNLTPQEIFDTRKHALIQEKRAEGNAIAQEHENLVSSPSLRDFFGDLMKREYAVKLHEMFHLQERVLLLDYNPKVDVTFLIYYNLAHHRNSRSRETINQRTSSRCV